MADDEQDATNAKAHASPPRRISAGALLAVLGFAFVVLRIFAVSQYDWETAFLVSTTLSLNDGLALVFGSLMAGYLLTAFLLMLVLPLLVAAYLWGRRRHRAVVLLFAALGLVVLVALTVSFSFWWLPVAAAVVFAIYALVRRLPRKNRVRRGSTIAMANVGWIVGIAVLLLAALVETPWVPHERIETSDGTINGYVLSVESGFLNVLTDDHEFVILVRSGVLSRT